MTITETSGTYGSNNTQNLEGLCFLAIMTFWKFGRSETDR